MIAILRRTIRTLVAVGGCLQVAAVSAGPVAGPTVPLTRPRLATAFFVGPIATAQGVQGCTIPGVDEATHGEDNLYNLAIRMGAPDAAALLPQISQAMTVPTSPGVGGIPGGNANAWAQDRLWDLFIYQVRLALLMTHVRRMVETRRNYSDLTYENSDAVRAFATLLRRGHLITNERDPRFTGSNSQPGYLGTLNHAISRNHEELRQGDQGYYHSTLKANGLYEGSVRQAIGDALVNLVKMGVEGESPITPTDPEVAQQSACPVAGVASLRDAQLSTDPAVAAKRSLLISQVKQIDPEATKMLLRIYEVEAQPIVPEPELQAQWSASEEGLYPGQTIGFPWDSEQKALDAIRDVYRELLLKQMQVSLSRAGVTSSAASAYRAIGGDPGSLEDLDVRGVVNGVLSRTKSERVLEALMPGTSPALVILNATPPEATPRPSRPLGATGRSDQPSTPANSTSDCRIPGVDEATPGADNLYNLAVRMNAPDAAALLPQISQAMSVKDPKVGSSAQNRLWDLFAYQVGIGLLTTHVKRMAQLQGAASDLSYGSSDVARAYATFLRRGHLVAGENDPRFTDYYLRSLNQSTDLPIGREVVKDLEPNALNAYALIVQDSISIVVFNLVQKGVEGKNPITPVDPEIAQGSSCPVVGIGTLATAQLSSDPNMRTARSQLVSGVRQIDPEAAKNLLRLYEVRNQPTASQDEQAKLNAVVAGYRNLIVDEIRTSLRRNAPNSAPAQAYRTIGGDPANLRSVLNVIDGALQATSATRPPGA